VRTGEWVSLGTPAGEVELALRVPDWASESTVDGEPVAAGSYARLRRVFRAGERVVMDMPMPPRLLASDERVDATRGCVAVARGPLVYAIEQPDQPPGITLEDVRIAPAAQLHPETRPDLLDGVVVLHASGRPSPIILIPYYAWANRGLHAMRVWIPAA
jgi:uncharacterized protein